MTYGRRVVGDAAWAEQKAVSDAAISRGLGLGKRVTGPAEPIEPVDEADLGDETDEHEEQDGDEGKEGQEEEKEEQEGGDEGEEKPDVDEEKEGEDAADLGTLSVAEIERTLAETNTEAIFDKIMAAEFERPEGLPRRTALRVLIDAEKRREVSRAPIIAELTAALARK